MMPDCSSRPLHAAVIALFAGLAVYFAMPARAGDQKLTVDELIAHHLDAIAPAAARAQVKTRGSRGTVHYEMIQGGRGQADGDAMLISEGRKISFAIGLPSTQYPGERVISDGERVFAAPIRAGLRSALGSFLFHHSQVVTEGLFGGVLSTAWPLLNVGDTHAKLKYDGQKKVDGVMLHELSYAPAKARTDVRIYLYFDPETFRHVKTIYRFTLQPGMANSPLDTPAEQLTQWIVQEDFGGFRAVEGFTLPSEWSVRLSVEGQRGLEQRWRCVFARTDTNPALNPKDLIVP